MQRSDEAAGTGEPRSGARGARHRGHLVFYVFLLAFAGQVSDIASGKAQPAWLSGAALVVFIACFVLNIELAHHRTGDWPPLSGPPAMVRLRTALLVVMAAVAVASTIAWGPQSLVLFVFVVATAVAMAPPRRAPLVIALVAALAAAAELANGVGTVGVSTAAAWALSIVMAGVVTLLLRRRTVLIGELRRSQTEVARLAAADAVTEERLRFARDLHDLLGHSLSVIVLKAELARRLLERGDLDGQARTEVAEVEQLARRALVEVREAVAGYRAPSLAAELERSEAALRTAGIAVDVRGMPESLPPEADELLAWVVREATTNIVRHSAAKHTEIAAETGDDRVRLDVTDDGTGGASGGSAEGGGGETAEDGRDWLAGLDEGSGLRGLEERVAAAGGRFAAGPAAGGGFRVSVAVPLPVTERAPEAVAP